LTDAAPDEKTQHAWVRLEGLHLVDAPKSSCPDIPAASTEDAYFNCGGEYESVSSTDVVVFLQGYLYAGHTYRRLEDSRLNQCIKTCRDEQKCVGFFYSARRSSCYSARRSSCELKDGGNVDFENLDFKDPPQPTFAGVKLVD
jgi:hypothetical protein